MLLRVCFVTALLTLLGSFATLVVSIPEASATTTSWSQLGTLPPTPQLVISAVSCPSVVTKISEGEPELGGAVA